MSGFSFKRLRDSTMGFKLTVAFMLVILIPMTLMAYISYRVIDGYLMKEARSKIETALKVAWTDYYVRGEQMRFGMLQAAASEEIKRAVKRKDRAYLKKMMLRWKQRRPYVDIWTIVDASGRVIARLNNDIYGDPFDLNGIISASLADGEARVSTEIIPREVIKAEGHAFTEKAVRRGERRPATEIEEGMALTVSVPVVDDMGNPIGAIITADILNNETFIPDMVASKMPGIFTTISMNGKRIATNLISNNGYGIKETKLTDEILSGIDTGKDLWGELQIEGRTYLAVFAAIRDGKGRIIGSLDVGISRDSLWVIQKRNMQIIALITVIGLLLSLVTASFSTRRLTRPLNALKEKLESFGRGDMSARVAVDFRPGTRDEINMLARTYNAMMEEVTARAEEKERYLRVIEAMNREATSINDELKIKNDELEVAYEEMQSQTEELHAINEELKLLNEDLDRKNMELKKANETISRDEQEVRAAKDRLRLTYDSIRDYMLVVDYEHNIIEANRHFIDSFGVDPSSVYGRKVCGFFNITQPVMECSVRKSIDSMSPTEHEMAIPDGKVLRWHSYPLVEENADVKKAVVYIKDITEQRLLTQKLMHSDKLSSLGELVSGVAHELNNPLTGIMCFSELLMEERLSADVLVKLGKINDASYRCKKIIDNLLTFARWRKPEKKYEDINGIVMESVELRAYQLKVENIGVELNLASVPRTMLDSGQMLQVFINLLNNARDAILEAGRAGKIIITSGSGASGKIQIRVEDTGKGFSEDFAARIFDPFFTTKAVGKGTGLGLSISYGIVNEHGGEIYALARPGGGAIFVVELPVVAERPGDEQAGAGETFEVERVMKAASGKRALILDDEPVVLDVLDEALKMAGFIVERSERAEAALEGLRHNDYDVIISDMKMPGLDGRDFYREAKNLKPDAASRIIFITGDNINKETSAFLSALSNYYLKKPFTIDQLYEVVLKLIT